MYRARVVLVFVADLLAAAGPARFSKAISFHMRDASRAREMRNHEPLHRILFSLLVINSGTCLEKFDSISRRCTQAVLFGFFNY